MSPGPISRRRFLTTTAAAAAAPWILPRAARGANERLNIAVIGVQGQGWWNLTQIKSENIVALCDVDATHLGRAGGEFPKAERYRDYRVMLENQRDIDAVLIATPDHSHAPAATAAMHLGKHVYCEKPLAHSVYEARVMAQLAAEHGLATQMGTQIHATGNYRRVVELIRAGVIGPVREVHVWCRKSWSDGRFKTGAPVPPKLDWDLWLGPASQRPYSEGVHPANWRRFWEYGTGTLGDMACHYVDLVHWALDLRNPVRVRTLGPVRHETGTPDSIIVHWDHPARGDMPAVRVTWYDGRNRPSILSALRTANESPLQWGDGQLFVGDEGMIISDYSRHLLLPEEKFAGFEGPRRSIPLSIGHHDEWIEACKTGSPTTCNFDYSGALSETVLLGNVAFRVGRTLEWDAESMTATNAPEAEPYLRPKFRTGWTL